MSMDNYENKGGHNDMPPTSPRPEPPKGQSDNLLVWQQTIYQKPDGTGERHLLFNKAKRLEQTLTEIKEIMKKHCKKCKKHKFYNFKLCCACKYTDILQKIREVENERN